MMQVAGGMDRLPAALAARLGNRIAYRAAVREIRQSERGVWVIYADAEGRPRRVDADYCVSTIPLPVLTGIQKDLSQPVQSAIAAATLRRRRQDRPAVQAAVLGTGRRDLWRPIVDRPGGRTDHLPVARLHHGQRRARRLLPGFPGTMRERPPAERSAARARAGRPRSSAILDRVRDGVLRHVGARAMEPRLVAVGIGVPRIRRSRRFASLTAASISPATT